MNIDILKNTASKMVAQGKGILAIDESMSTCKKRFDALGVPCDESTRQDYREMLVTAPGIEEYVSGYILFDETLRQSTKNGVPFAKILKDKGILVGIKVDKGPHPLALSPGELVTEGLDGLRERLAEYKALGAEFAKWRAVININENLPTETAVYANCHALARYAALCQEQDIVPMVEPEIMIDGNHDLEACFEVSTATWEILFNELDAMGVALEGTILKTSMVIAGTSYPNQSTVQEVAENTVSGLIETVPAELAGIVFLSGGQTNIQSTEHLNAMNQLEGKFWPLSFSYGRAIQDPALKYWAQNQNDHAGAQKLLVHRAKMNSLASLGKYSSDLEI